MKKLFIVGPAAGGLAKTSCAEMAYAAHMSRREKLFLVDCDAANGSLSRRLGPGTTDLHLRSFDSLEGTAERIWAGARQAKADAVLLDLGASALVLGGVDALLGELLDLTAKEGVEAWFVLATVPNKPGAVAELKRTLRMSWPDHVRKALVMTDTDGSGAFGNVADLQVDARIQLGHVMPGLMALRREFRGSPVEAALRHGPGYGRGAGMLAAILLRLLLQEDWTRVFGPLGLEAEAALTALAARAPSWHYSGRRTLEDVADATLEADEAMILAMHRLQSLKPGAAASELLAAAQAFVTANARRNEVRDLTRVSPRAA